MSDDTTETWEQRMSTRAQARIWHDPQGAEIAAREGLRQVYAEYGVTLDESRWDEHHQDPRHPCPTYEDESWPDHTACRTCFSHDDQGRVEMRVDPRLTLWWQSAEVTPDGLRNERAMFMPHWSAVRTCTDPCGCFCHVIVHQVCVG